MLEMEKTCLVLENERQSEQYQKCLDDITSQVLQAVMAQRVTVTPSLFVHHLYRLAVCLHIKHRWTTVCSQLAVFIP